MHTERFTHFRKDILKKVFEKKSISAVWRKVVRSELKRLDFQDIYDYYDFHYNIEDRAQTIRNEIINGNYRVSKPTIYRIEKKFGVCRHLVIPQPADTLVIQVLTESIRKKLIDQQPSKNAFYSSSRHKTKNPHEAQEYGLSTIEEWKNLQEKIYQFSESKNLTVVTDISNYYDSIDLDTLRNFIMLRANTSEVLIDLLFHIIEEISWRPDYLPYKRRGLPTSNLEGIRLLAHAFLFELDEFLKKKTNNCFTRWMDDITFGIDSTKEAIETISSVSDILKSRGLAINLSKTAIYDYEKTSYNYLIDFNNELSKIQESSSNEYLDGGLNRQNLIRSFKEFLNIPEPKPKQWDKVLKRFINLFAKYKSFYLLDFIQDIYITVPSVRSSILYYLKEIGYNEKSSNVVLGIFENMSIYDDVSLFLLCKLVTDWKIGFDSKSSSFVKDIDNAIVSNSGLNKMFFHFYCTIYFKVKYSHHEDLLDYIKKYHYIWQGDNFLRRQVTCALARIYTSNKDEIYSILQTQMSSGIIEVVSAATQILRFAKISNIDKRLDLYLFHNSHRNNYPLHKFLVLCSVLNSREVRRNQEIKSKVLDFIDDPYYLKWLEMQYNIVKDDEYPVH